MVAVLYHAEGAHHIVNSVSPFPCGIECKGDFVLFPVAVGILISEGDKHLLQFLGGFRHIQPQLIQPCAVNPVLGINNILRGFITGRQGTDFAVRGKQRLRIVIPGAEKFGYGRRILIQIVIQDRQLFKISRHIHIPDNRIRKAVRAEHDIYFLIPA